MNLPDPVLKAINEMRSDIKELKKDKIVIYTVEFIFKNRGQEMLFRKILRERVHCLGQAVDAMDDE